MKNTPIIRFRIDFGGLASLGRGKVELLEHIANCGSLSQAAREMGMSYRRAWLLMDSMNKSFDEAVSTATAGGHGGGGVVLAQFGLQLIAAYRALEQEITDIAVQRLSTISQRVNKRRVVKKSSANATLVKALKRPLTGVDKRSAKKSKTTRA